MKAYKVVLLIVDHDNVGHAIKDEIENARYPNRCIDPHVMSIDSAEIGEWADDHPLNSVRSMAEEFKRLFPAAKTVTRKKKR